MQRERQFVRLRREIVVALAVLCLPTANARATDPSQNPPGTTQAVAPFPGFDIISIKPNHSGSGSMSIDTDDYKFTAENATLGMMLVSAYGIRQDLISGIPAWAREAHWDVRAKMVGPPNQTASTHTRSDDEVVQYEQQRWQSVLKERFHLVAHTEQRTLPVYDLVVISKDQKLHATTAAASDWGNTRTHNQDMTGTGVTMASFVWTLSDIVGRNVEDKTGLDGHYDLHLRWSTDRQLSTPDSGATDRPPSIYTALQEQLGLKLVPAKGPVHTLVVDSVQPPSPD